MCVYGKKVIQATLYGPCERSGRAVRLFYVGRLSGGTGGVCYPEGDIILAV